MSNCAVTLDFKTLRKASGYTQTSLAFEIRSSPVTINYIEKYGHIPGYLLRKRLAKALGVNPSDLWPNHEDRN